MSQRVKHFLLALLCISAIGPAAYMPRLSAHSPTFSAPSQTHQHAPGLPEAVRLSPLVGMAIRVKDAGAVATKWKQRASNAQQDYASGVQASAGEWEQKAAAAEDLYKAAVTDAAAKGAYGRGVRGSGAKYLKNATTLGPQRFAQGVGNAQDAMAAAIAPVLQTISALTLPPRQVKGNNQERSNIVATALRKMKAGQ